MILKCGNKQIRVSNEDIVLDNGACFQIITKNVCIGWFSYPPKLAKTKAIKLIKNGVLVLREENTKKGLKYYSFAL